MARSHEPAQGCRSSIAIGRVGKDFELIRQFDPLGRVPALVLADGESLIDSAAILDFLDDLVGPERALLPRLRQGAPRS